MIEDDALIEALADAMGAGYYDRLRASANLALAETPEGDEHQTTREGLIDNAKRHADAAATCRRAAEAMRAVLAAREREIGEFGDAVVGRVTRRQIVAQFPRYRVAGPVGRRELVWTEALEVQHPAADVEGVATKPWVERLFLQYVYDAARDTIRTGMIEPEE